MGYLQYLLLRAFGLLANLLPEGFALLVGEAIGENVFSSRLGASEGGP